jgi:uncharacterized protein YqgV (UPF0045/DUF77 family)
MRPIKEAKRLWGSRENGFTLHFTHYTLHLNKEFLMGKISAHMSVYPLRQEEVSPGIGAALDALTENGINYEVGLMGTMLWGEDKEIFLALLAAFRKAASVGRTTMVVTISNASPWPGGEE